ncbi:hypothetical protein SPRG_09310 [Saprolegnia parasitica CBS 223.65]|uniref:Uncharacterized protein n=1 Tax=Saprolegnia parasitica (strain CBS 223.65) TaxID=695850 RepID=A0A067CF52_SAPPC|nr:hypothetical protein SPRG_09310 [Saprolegnia parasitica CBS 223.65]KDO25161.1 hypothetical protein SPRG_09310 [Saprolegnia parasitica CBS 223.65]|eukprot:XP_012204229.1 hypothetical protein SPRG_09310 [Saprolegnia parasitica CBS 223.65]
MHSAALTHLPDVLPVRLPNLDNWDLDDLVSASSDDLSSFIADAPKDRAPAAMHHRRRRNRALELELMITALQSQLAELERRHRKVRRPSNNAMYALAKAEGMALQRARRKNAQLLDALCEHMRLRRLLQRHLLRQTSTSSYSTVIVESCSVMVYHDDAPTFGR